MKRKTFEKFLLGYFGQSENWFGGREKLVLPDGMKADVRTVRKLSRELCKKYGSYQAALVACMIYFYRDGATKDYPQRLLGRLMSGETCSKYGIAHRGIAQSNDN